jgi:hypothetical protein
MLNKMVKLLLPALINPGHGLQILCNQYQYVSVTLN